MSSKENRGAWTPDKGRVMNPLRDWPRNQECFCGSLKKFKKCHGAPGAQLPGTVKKESQLALIGILRLAQAAAKKKKGV